MRRVKGQAATETLLTFGIVLAFIIPVVLFIFMMSGYQYEKVSKYQADATVKNIAHALNLVYIEGSNSSRTLLINLPSNTKSLRISSNEVLIDLDVTSGEYESTYPLLFNTTGELVLEGRKGLLRLYISNVDGSITVGEAVR